MKKTKIIVGLLAVASMLALNPIGVSAEWKQDSTGWWYNEGNSWYTGWKQIDGKWYYFSPSTGYMATDVWMDGYYIGTDGTIPKSVGFDKMSLAGGTWRYNDGYNKKFWTNNDISYLSIGGTDYKKIFNDGNILIPSDWSQISGDDNDYIFNLANKYSRFTATAGIDDLTRDKSAAMELMIIADGNVLYDSKLKNGEEAVNIDVNLSGYSKLIIRAERKQGGGDISCDILGGKFYFK